MATDGESRSPSMALTAAREMPARSASSACDQSRACRRACTGFIADLVCDMILSFIAIILSPKDKKICARRNLCLQL